MADLNIPNLNKKSNKYLFKNKSKLRRKSKRKILLESFYMLMSSSILFFLNFLIPNKNFLFQNFFKTFEKLLLVIVDFFYYLYQLSLVIFILISIVLGLILLVGAAYRIYTLLKKNTKKFLYK